MYGFTNYDLIYHWFIQRFFDAEYSGYDDQIGDSKTIDEKRGVISVQFSGRFNMENSVDFKVQFNCTTSCQNGAIGASSKIQLSFSTFCQEIFLREYSINLTIAANIKKKYDDAMAQMDGSSDDSIQLERSRKRRRTSKYN